MKLATIQKIIDIKPIEGADAIELAFVLGWQVVVKKGEFKVGDLCIYIQIDTVVPDKPEFEFLRSRNFRVRTIKLRKQLSQGIIFPMNILPDKSIPTNKMLIDYDVTELLEIKKYEKPDNNPYQEQEKKPKSGIKKLVYILKYNYLYRMFPNLRPKSRSPFPTHLIPITDEERIQNMPKILEEYKDQLFSVSYKLDGSSITIIRDKGLFGKPIYRICSRRFELHDKNNDWYNVFKDTNFEVYIERLARIYNHSQIIVQGEAIGKFNGNHHGLEKNEIRLFNIYVDGKRLRPNEFYDACSLTSTPRCPEYTKKSLNFSMSEILKFSEIKDCINTSVPAEGLVWRSLDGKISFKVINNEYLLTEE